MQKHKYFKHITIIVLFIALIINIAAPLAVYADDTEKKVVRVGWHEPPYFITDQMGRHSGYSYEYQRKLAAYTGWEYEYVEGTWTDLMQMLKRGEIDLMSDVSYTDERTKDMLFSSIPMGTEVYYIFVSPDNDEITAENISALNGKRIGVTKDSIQRDYLIDWIEKRGIDAEIVELNGSGEDSLKLLGTQLDAYVTMDVYSSPDTAVPIYKIGSSDFYFVVSNTRPDILTELDTALNKIQDENKYYDQQLHDKYLKSTETSKYLSLSEREWLAEHGIIRVGYQDNYLAFCAQDPQTGALTGALKDYLNYASKAFENAQLNFTAVSYPTAAAALEALKNGEIDCMFPSNLTDYDAEQLDLITTPSIMHSEMDAVVRASEQKEFLIQDNVTVAINEGNTNYDIFLSDNYPTWQRAYFKDTPACLDAVAQKKADCVIISNYRYSNISKQCEKLHLAKVYTGVDMDYNFAMREGDTQLYSILARLNCVLPDSAVHSALTYYSTEDVKTGFVDLIKDNLFIVLFTLVSILLIISILFLHSIRAEKKILEDEHLVKALNKRAFVDALTSVHNKGAFFEYIRKLQDGADRGDISEFAIGMFDCNNLKLINDQYGHDKGDIYLKTACQLICNVFYRSPVFRIGGDEFAVILQNEDFDGRDELVELFVQKRNEISAAASNKWEETHIALGIAVYDPMVDSSVSDTIRRADKIMYENKRTEKQKQI